ncbi:MAG: DUF429 domain-containing protein [Spirochaetia bacterium]
MATLLCEYMYSTAPPFHLQDFSRVRVAGIDGCRGGWFAVLLENPPPPGGRYGGAAESPPRVAGTFLFGTEDHHGLEHLLEGVSLALIDIPIGLPGRTERASDSAVRKLLGARGRSIFPMPVREAVYAASYEEACRINAASTGKKLSKQTWNILAKVKSIDRFLRLRKKYLLTLRESAPEYCFVLAGSGRGPFHGKRTREGFRERSVILASSIPGWDRVHAEVRDSFPRRVLADDDILDAGVLAYSASLAVRGKTVLFPSVPEHDDYGLPIQTVFGTPV